jgi:hypothetical protein
VPKRLPRQCVVKQKGPELIILDLNFSISTTGEEGMALLGNIKKADDCYPGDTDNRLGQH